MTATATATGCAACGRPLNQPKRGRRRKWCSERCRKTKYAYPCVDCGDMIPHDGRIDRYERCRECAHQFNRSDMAYRRQMGERNSGAAWTDTALLAALRSQAVNGRVTVTAYRAASSGDPALPGSQAIMNRFETWGQACRAAGLEDHGYGIRSDRLTREGAMLAFADCAAELDGRPPTVNEYTAWAQRTGSPSESLLRWRWGSWTQLVVAYLEQQEAA
jgi:predicted nucleic acid-binding Zn ribbon protein